MTAIESCRGVGQDKADLIRESLGVQVLEQLAWMDPEEVESVDGLSGGLVQAAQESLPDWHDMDHRSKTVRCAYCDEKSETIILKTAVNSIVVHERASCKKNPNSLVNNGGVHSRT